MRHVLSLLVFMIAVAVMIALLAKGAWIAPEFRIPAVVASIFFIGFFSIVGLFEKSVVKYACYSTVIQVAYFLLDVSTAILIGKSVWFAVIQLINFVIAGSLFLAAVALIQNHARRDRMHEYAGFYDKNQLLVLALVIGCLSLGGMPGFNIFVGEYLIYGALFSVHPALMVAAIFAGLLCFMFYFRICYIMFAGKEKEAIRMGLFSKAVLGVLAAATVILGVVPGILMTVLEWYA